MNFDKFNEVVNGEMTYTKIAEELIDTGKCIIGWTDELHDHRDILFTYKPKKFNSKSLQRGLYWCSFYVSIMDFSCMGFLIENLRDNTKDNGYIKEKLQLVDNVCDDKICDLINGVIHQIDLMEHNVWED